MWKKITGYVILQVQGLSLDRFLRRLLLSGIPVCDITHVNLTTATLTIPAKDFPKLLPIRRREHCKIRILEKHGLPFWWKKVFVRPVLWIGIPMSAIVLAILCSRIWMIQIDGTERTDPQQVLTLLQEHGLAVGKRPKGNVLILAADDLSARLPEAAWVSLNREGILLRVTVSESLPKHDPIDWTVPADLIASKDAVIVSVQTKRGQCKVVPGQAVRKGDVLIAGHVVYSSDKTAYDTHADGIVTGCCLYEAEADFPKTVQEYAQTGQTETLYDLFVCSFPVIGQESSFSESVTLETSEKQISSFLFPIILRKTVYAEVAMRERILSEEEQREQAEIYAVNDAISLVPHDAKICSIHTVEQQQGKRVFVRCTIVTEETIQQSREIAQ